MVAMTNEVVEAFVRAGFEPKPSSLMFLVGSHAQPKSKEFAVSAMCGGEQKVLQVKQVKALEALGDVLEPAGSSLGSYEARAVFGTGQLGKNLKLLQRRLGPDKDCLAAYGRGAGGSANYASVAWHFEP